jgi:hypothetical protein
MVLLTPWLAALSLRFLVFLLFFFHLLCHVLHESHSQFWHAA